MAMALGIATGVLAFIATIFMAMAGRSGPVSYTHLDVYKRQMLGGVISRGLCRGR